MARKEKVTKVIDGDTFETASRKNPVRLTRVGDMTTAWDLEKKMAAMKFKISPAQWNMDTIRRWMDDSRE